MADSIFDLQNMQLSDQYKPKSFYDQFLEQRALLQQQRPDVAAQMPAIGANTPGERQFQAARQEGAQDLASTVQQAVAPVAQAAAGPTAKPKDQQAAQAGVAEILSPLNPLEPKKLYGPNIGESLGMGPNAGGILGLGVQPIDVLSFALFAGLTSRMPQEQAMKMTMWGAGLPKAFRDNQEKQALEFLKAKQTEANTMLSQGNLQMRQQEHALNSELKNLQMLKQLEGLDAISKRKVILDGIQKGEIDVSTQTGRAIALSALKPEEIKSLLGPQARTGQQLSMRTREIMAAAEEGGKPLSIAEARKQALEEEVQLAGNKAGAVSAQQPLPPTVQANITKLGDVAGQIQALKDNYHPDFVGPVAYRTYNARRQGVGPAPSPREVKFHQAQEYLQDIRLRVQSGAATSEPEAARILGTLPQGTDMPGVYGAGLTKALKDTMRTLESTKKMGVTPKGELKQEQSGGVVGAPPAGAIIWRIDPKTGQMTQMKAGQ
jgi:hypothetical protein